MRRKKIASEKYQELINDWKKGYYSIRELDEKLSNLNEEYGTKYELITTNHFNT